MGIVISNDVDHGWPRWKNPIPQAGSGQCCCDTSLRDMGYEHQLVFQNAGFLSNR